MSTVETTFHPAVTAAVLSGGQWFPAVNPESPDAVLQLNIPDFDLHFEAPVSDIAVAKDYSEVLISAFIEPGVSAKLRLRNEAITSVDEPLQIKEVILNFEVSTDRPRTLFVSDSLYALLGLAESINIVMPELDMSVGVHFEMPLSGVSNLLQRRQIYFGLIVIERATGLEFRVPEFIPGEDIDAISFSYHAIVARDFRWLNNEVTLFVPATNESLVWIESLPTVRPGGAEYKMVFGPTPTIRRIFGQTVSLGEETVFLDDAVIVNREEMIRRIALKDGTTVPVTFRPRSRMGRYLLPDAPRLSDGPWDKNVVGSIALENTLDERLATRYHELAASTLAGLTVDEIKAVTEPPTLDLEAHLIGD